MKKFLLLIIVILIIGLAGCAQKTNINNSNTQSGDIIENEVSQKYLLLNNTSIDDLIAQSDMVLSELDDGAQEINLGKVKLNEKEYNLNLYFNIDKEDSVVWGDNLKLKIENDNFSNIIYESEYGGTIVDNSFNFGEKISILSDKYIVVSGFIGGQYKFLNVFSENERVFNKSGLKLDYSIENDKLLYQVYNELVSEEQPFKYYRAYYEIIEEEGEIKDNQIKVDYDDIYQSAQMT